MRYLLAFLAVVALVSCTTEPRRLSATNTTVVYEVSRANVHSAQDEAMEYCADLGRTAHLRDVIEYGETRQAVYECM